MSYFDDLRSDKSVPFHIALDVFPALLEVGPSPLILSVASLCSAGAARAVYCIRSIVKSGAGNGKSKARRKTLQDNPTRGRTIECGAITHRINPLLQSVEAKAPYV